MQRAGQVPESMRFIVAGAVALRVRNPNGLALPVGLLRAGDYLGQSSLTRQSVTADAIAAEETTVVRAPGNSSTSWRVNDRRSRRTSAEPSTCAARQFATR